MRRHIETTLTGALAGFCAGLFVCSLLGIEDGWMLILANGAVCGAAALVWSLFRRSP